MTSPSSSRGWLVLVAAGLLFIVLGGVTYATCASSSVVASCGALAGFAFLGVLLLIGGVVAWVVAARRPTLMAPPVNPAVPPPIINPVVIQQTVQEQVVKIRCRYCGALADANLTTCPQCGAPL